MCVLHYCVIASMHQAIFALHYAVSHLKGQYTAVSWNVFALQWLLDLDPLINHLRNLCPVLYGISLLASPLIIMISPTLQRITGLIKIS